jgi:serine/threonine protein kinase
VIDLLGLSVRTIMSLCGGKLENSTVVALTEQLITRVETFHSKGFLHNDIKPENFAVGRGTYNKTVYIIDYGLARRYRNAKTKMHIPFRENKKLIGTVRYSSINTHLGYEQSRRDDLECLAYSFIYMAKGQLPWQGIKADTKEKRYKKIMKVKEDIPIEALCKGIPTEFARYLYYCRNLKFEEEPNYESLRSMFRHCMHKYKYDINFSFTWIKRQINLNAHIDSLSAYKKVENNLNVCNNEQNPSSNKAESNNDEDAIVRAKSREISKGELERHNGLKVKLSEETHKRKPSYGSPLNPNNIANNEPRSPVIQRTLNNTTKQEETKELPLAQIERNKHRTLEIQKLMQGVPDIMRKKKDEDFRGKELEECKKLKVHDNILKITKVIESSKEVDPKLNDSKAIPETDGVTVKNQNEQLSKLILLHKYEISDKDLQENEDIYSKLRIKHR